MSVMKNQREIFLADTVSGQKIATEKTERANDLQGKEWLQNSISIWSDIRRTPEELKLGHPAMFPIALVSRVLRSFTTAKQKVVLDPFLGSGTTLLAAASQGKGGYGFDISPEYVKLARTRLRSQCELFSKGELDIHVILDNAASLQKYITKESVDICVTSPPYWNILQQKRSADNKEARDYDVAEGNLGKIDDYGKFLRELGNIFESVYVVLKRGRYCVVNVMDIRKRAKFYMLHADFTLIMQEIGFALDDLIIWDRRSEYNNFRPLGYPSVFRVNRAHEYLLIFQKP